MATYCTEDDMVKVRANIMDLGVASWEDQLTEAKAVIDRAIEVRWYRQAVKDYGSERGPTRHIDYREYPFDPDLMLNAGTQLTRLAVYKTLQLAYMFLATDAPEPSAFERQAKTFESMYSTELSDVLAQGIDYDWDGSGALDYTEKRTPSMRRLSRC